MVRLTTRGRPRLTSSLVRSGLAAASLAIPFVTDLGPWLAPALLPMAHGLSGLWLGKGLLESDDLRQQHRAWHVSPDWELAPTDVPQGDKGLLLGQAFPWTGEHTQFLETALAVDGSLPTASGARGGYPVLHAVGQHEEQTLRIPWSEVPGHVLITGTTGSGKTVLLEILADGAIHRPGPTIIIDPKGGRGFLARCAAEAKRAGKPFALLTPAFPQQSAAMNVLGTATTPAEVSARIRALMPSGGGRAGDPFFEEYPLALIELVAAAQQALGQSWSLEGLYRVCMIRQHQEQLVEDYLLSLGCHTGKKVEDTISEYQKRFGNDLIADALIDDLQKLRDHFTKVTSNLRPAFRGVVGVPLGPLFSPGPNALTWQRIVDENIVVYLSLASMLIGDIANRIGRVILQDLVGYLGRRQAYEDLTHAVPITVIIDEAARVAYPLFTVALAMAREAKAAYVLAQQSLADMEAALGNQALARQVYDNCNTRIWLRVADDKTALEATEGLGTCTVELPENGTSLGYGGVGGLSGSATRRLTQKDVPLLRSSWLTALPRGEAVVRMRGEVLKLRIPLLTPVSDAEREALGLTQLWEKMPEDKEPPPVVLP